MSFLATLKSGLALTAISFFGLFGGHAHIQPIAPPASGTPAATTARGTIRASASVDIACVAQAVATRESTLDSAEASLTGALDSAYTTRASALAAAYAQSSTSSVQAAVKASWNSFDSSVKGARQSWKQAQLAAWQAFATATKSCGTGAASVSDAANASADGALGE